MDGIMGKSLYRILNEDLLGPNISRSTLKEVKEYYLNKLPKEKTFDSMANSSEENKCNVKIYNNLLTRIKTIIKRG